MTVLFPLSHYFQIVLISESNFIVCIDRVRIYFNIYLYIYVFFSTGNGRTGVYIALNIALECLRKDEYIDMFQVVKQLRYERPYMIQTQEQYEYCYHVLNDYFKNFDHLLHAL